MWCILGNGRWIVSDKRCGRIIGAGSLRLWVQGDSSLVALMQTAVFLRARPSLCAWKCVIWQHVYVRL